MWQFSRVCIFRNCIACKTKIGQFYSFNYLYGKFFSWGELTCNSKAYSFLQGRNGDTDGCNRLAYSRGWWGWNKLRKYHWHVSTIITSGSCCIPQGSPAWVLCDDLEWQKGGIREVQEGRSYNYDRFVVLQNQCKIVK